MVVSAGQNKGNGNRTRPFTGMYTIRAGRVNTRICMTTIGGGFRFRVSFRHDEERKVVNSEEEIRCIPEKREALLQFKVAIVDDYGMLSSWTTSHCCESQGIRCNNLTYHISILDLHGEYPDDSGRYMSGEIHMLLMGNLRYLDLLLCGFHTEIPSQLGSLSHLKYLNLGWNYLEGSIPEQLGNLFHLHHLDLSDNNFKGNIPPQLGNLCQLQHLDLRNIPPQLGILSQLQHLDLSDNLLEGNIPSQLGNLSQLQHLVSILRENVEIVECRSNSWKNVGVVLVVVDVGFLPTSIKCYNHFEANIPPQLGNLYQLQELYLRGYNALNLTHGGHWLSNLLCLTHLYLGSVSNFHPSHNLFQVIAKLPELRELSLADCSFSDHLIMSSKPSTSPSVLDLSQNTFTSGMVFKWVSNITSNLVELDLSQNHLKGFTSSDFGIVMNSLRHLHLSSNHFKKAFHPFLVIYLVVALDTHCKNWFCHGISSVTLFDISVFSSLKSLFLYGNRLSGRIPESVKLPSTLEDLLISGNFIEGGIPKSFGNACALNSLQMSDNSLSVELPTIISHLSSCARYSLEELNLDVNKINGTLPDFSTFTSLKRLYLGNNKLNGEIPKDIQFPPKLEGLYIYSNSLKGVLSDYHFANMSKLQDLDLSHNSLGLAFTQNWVPPFQLLTINLGSWNLGPTFPQWLQTK
ncbi:hypothetical protein V8G54_011033 [Vigna mungo]|uniref:Leucine-rich repeat-containing N-terminal plant-type domain-containing protein n=1 Tax=Vigna mungo TaxID=3915 RepID=A0AAQ3NQG7_VIGMU